MIVIIHEERVTSLLHARFIVQAVLTAMSIMIFVYNLLKINVLPSITKFIQFPIQSHPRNSQQIGGFGLISFSDS